MADGHIILDTRVDTTGVTKGFSAIKSGASSVLGTVGKIGAAIGIAFGVSALVKFAKQSIELSSDVQEVQNVVDVAFGDMKDQMEAFADTAIDKFGISALTAKRTGSTYMAMAKGMGIAGQEAADMALNLTGLSADMASFYNVSQKYTDIALKSVFTGETETLKQYGIVMTQTNLQEFARQKGITKSIQSMTQQEQTMLRYQYVMKQTALAQGDFVRTQNSWANQTRILSERWKEMQIVWGDAFRTIGTLVLPTVNSLIKGLTKVGEYAKAAAQAIARMFGKEIDSSEETSKNIENSVKNQNDLTQATEETTKAIQQQLAGFDEVNQISKETATEATKQTDTTQELPKKKDNKQEQSESEKKIEALQKKLQAFAENIKKIFAPIAQYLIDTFGSAFQKIGEVAGQVWNRISQSLSRVVDTVKKIAEPIKEVFQNDILPIIAGNIENLVEDFNKISEAVHEIFDRIYTEAIEPFILLFVNIWGDMWDDTKKVWDERSKPIHDAFQNFIDSIKDIILTLWDNVLKPIADGLRDTIDWLWEKHLKKLWHNLLEFFASLQEFALTIWNYVLGPFVEYVIAYIGPKIAWAVNSIRNVLATVFAWISDIVSGWLRTMRGVMDFITGVFTGNWKKAWNGIKDIFGGIWDAMYGSVKFVINLIIDALNTLWGAIYSVVSGIVNGVGKIAKAFGKLIGKDWEFSMPAKPPYIPKLAQGAVLPANKPFLAQLGDQTNGRNLEAPESLLREIYSEQNQPMINILTQMLDELKKGRVMVANGREIAKTVREGEKQLGSYTGGLTFG